MTEAIVAGVAGTSPEGKAVAVGMLAYMLEAREGKISWDVPLDGLLYRWVIVEDDEHYEQTRDQFFSVIQAVTANTEWIDKLPLPTKEAAIRNCISVLAALAREFNRHIEEAASESA